MKREEERKREEEERIHREMEEKMRKEEEDRIRREEEERKRKEEEERLRREEEERNRIEGQISAITFIFHALNRNGEPKTTGGDTDAFEVTSNGEKITMIEDAGDGTYTVDYNCVPGINEVDVKYKGQSIKGFPVVFSI
uniref:Uncharacterized protein n=1 Tax=Arcella intermedia TaxID=1963864 RepID=A0A6B2LMX3_9EUKA